MTTDSPTTSVAHAPVQGRELHDGVHRRRVVVAERPSSLVARGNTAISTEDDSNGSKITV
jgi:hypothetical protein